MPKYTVFMETTIIKRSTVRDIEAPTMARAVEIADERLKRNDVDWGVSQIDRRFLNVEEQK